MASSRLRFICVAVASTLAAAANIGTHYVEVGATSLSTPKDTVKVEESSSTDHTAEARRPPIMRSGGTRTQWFGSDLGAPAEDQQHDTKHGHHHDEMHQRGFNLDEVWAEHSKKMKSHIHPESLEDEGEGEHQQIRANAGIPILQAARTKPKSGRYSWARDVDDPDPGDGEDGPHDVLNNPGDALLEISSERKSVALQNATHTQKTKKTKKDEPVPAVPADTTCDMCKDCSMAKPNQPAPNNKSDGSWCMCNSWDDWQALFPSSAKGHGMSGQHAWTGADAACVDNCVDANATVLAANGCAALNCSCDLNVNWLLPGVTPAPTLAPLPDQ